MKRAAAERPPQQRPRQRRDAGQLVPDAIRQRLGRRQLPRQLGRDATLLGEGVFGGNTDVLREKLSSCNFLHASARASGLLAPVAGLEEIRQERGKKIRANVISRPNADREVRGDDTGRFPSVNRRTPDKLRGVAARDKYFA